MLKTVFPVLLILCVAFSAHAEVRYVTDNLKITLRTGQGIDHKILAMVESGVKVEVLQGGDDWSLIRIPDGKEGWVLTRFLTDTEPTGVALGRLQTKFDSLSAQADALRQENKDLKTENEQLKNELHQKQGNLSHITQSYDELKESSTEFLDLKAAHDKATKELTDVKKKAQTLEEELGSIQSHNSIRWFLSGGGVLIAGFLLGFSTRRSRKKSSLY
jgi:SH3 domain protein